MTKDSTDLELKSLLSKVSSSRLLKIVVVVGLVSLVALWLSGVPSPFVPSDRINGLDEEKERIEEERKNLTVKVDSLINSLQNVRNTQTIIIKEVDEKTKKTLDSYSSASVHDKASILADRIGGFDTIELADSAYVGTGGWVVTLRRADR